MRDERREWTTFGLGLAACVLVSWLPLVVAQAVDRAAPIVGWSLLFEAAWVGLVVFWLLPGNWSRPASGRVLPGSVVAPWTVVGALLSTVGLFTAMYWSLSTDDPTAFSEPLTRIDAIYFTLTSFTTTGFGDISAASQSARALVSLQLAVGLFLLAGAFAVVLGRVGNRGVAQP